MKKKTVDEEKVDKVKNISIKSGNKMNTSTQLLIEGEGVKPSKIVDGSKADENPHDSKKKGQPQQKIENEKSGLKFVNDSGTQINVWGVMPEAILDKFENVLPSNKTKDKENIPKSSTAMV